MHNIYRVVKTRVANPTSVRALLKRNKFDVGHWGDNGRISGLANFYGTVEVKEWEKETHYRTEESEATNTRRMYALKTVGVEIRTWKDKHNIMEIKSLLEKSGYKVKVDDRIVEKVLLVEKV